MKRARSLQVLHAALAIVAAHASIGAGFAAAGRPAGIAAAAASAVAWGLVLALGLPGASALLCVSVGLGALSAAAGAPAWICAAGAGASVAAWDLSNLAAGAPREAEPAREARLTGAHLRALGAGALPGVGLAGLLGHQRLELPFGVVVGVALVGLWALDRVARRG